MSEFVSLTINVKHTDINELKELLEIKKTLNTKLIITGETSTTHEHIHAGFYTKVKINTIRQNILRTFKKQHNLFKEQKGCKKGGNHFLQVKYHDDPEYFIGYICKEFGKELEDKETIYKRNNIINQYKEKYLKTSYEYYMSEKSQKKQKWIAEKSNGLLAYTLKEFKDRYGDNYFRNGINTTQKIAEAERFIAKKLVEKKVKEHKGLDPNIELRILRLAMAIISQSYKDAYINDLVNKM